MRKKIVQEFINSSAEIVLAKLTKDTIENYNKIARESRPKFDSLTVDDEVAVELMALRHIQKVIRSQRGV